MSFFNHQSIFFTVLGYPMSYLEFFGTMAGAIAVFLSAKANVWSWPLGIVNVVLFFFLFYQVQLYPDMVLQVFFFITNLVGWYRWLNPRQEEEDLNKQLKISRLTNKMWIFFALIGITGTVLFGQLAKNLNSLLPLVFSQPSAFPYADSFVTIMSIVATYLMVQKKVECWIVWIIVDAVACSLYFSKGILFVGIEYVAFCFIAAFGFYQWRKNLTESK